MEDETWRNEYVLNDTGEMYRGNYEQVGLLKICRVETLVCMHTTYE